MQPSEITLAQLRQKIHAAKAGKCDNATESELLLRIEEAKQNNRQIENAIHDATAWQVIKQLFTWTRLKP